MEPGSPLKRHFIDEEMPSVMSNQDGTIPDMIVSSQNPEISSQPSIISTSQTTGSRASSPVSSILDTIVIDVPPQPAFQVCIPTARSTVQDVPPPAKKRKLTSAEMELVKTQKVHKEQQKTKEKAQREEERARREEEKRAKTEERRLKEEERKEAKRKQEEDREEKRKQREAEKLAKDEEKRKRDAEKKAIEEEKAKKAQVGTNVCKSLALANKQQSQLRLNSFFTKPKSAAPREPPHLQERADLSGCNFTSSTDQPKDSSETPPLTQEAPEAQFKKDFPSFYVHTNTTMAPINRFVPDDTKLETVRLQIDQGLHSHDNTQPISSREVFHVRANKRRKLTPILSVKNLISQIHGTATRPVDLTKAKSSHKSPEELLRRIPMKILKFAEDVRPPYIGTYTKIPTSKSTMKLFRKPFTRALPSTNYDYDSEAEWEEPEEGEDLDSEDEKEPEEDDGDDITDFLDDDEEGMNSVKRRNIMGDVQPVYTQLHWEGSKKVKGPMMVPYGDTSLDMKPFRLEVLLRKTSFISINVPAG
jgi:chromatin assembly factor 1 subunit A